VVRGVNLDKDLRVTVVPIDLTGIATGGAASGVRSGVQVTGIGVTA